MCKYNNHIGFPWEHVWYKDSNNDRFNAPINILLLSQTSTDPPIDWRRRTKTDDNLLEIEFVYTKIYYSILYTYEVQLIKTRNSIILNREMTRIRAGEGKNTRWYGNDLVRDPIKTYITCDVCGINIKT